MHRRDLHDTTTGAPLSTARSWSCDGRLLAKMIIEKFRTFRERSATRSRMTTHVQPASEDRSEIHRVVLQIAGRILPNKQVDFGAHTDTDSLFSRGVSDHVPGRRLGRPSGHFGWSLTPLY